ncbi:MAG: rhomboid family intramembrane serine protease [Bacteriovoracaceae bacterium]
MNSYTMHTPTLTKINKIILITAGALFLLQSILSVNGIRLEGILGLIPEKMISGHLYQLVTYPFVAPGFFAILFNGMVIWFIGSDLEEKWGEKTYIKFFFFSILGAGLIYTLLGISVFNSTMSYFTPMMGLSGFCYSLLFAYAIIFADRNLSFMMLFPVKGKYFCMLIAGVELYMAFFSSSKASAWGHLGAALCGFLFLRVKSLSIAKGKLMEFKRQQNVEKAKGRLYIVPDEETEKKKPNKDDPKYWQ